MAGGFFPLFFVGRRQGGLAPSNAGSGRVNSGFGAATTPPKRKMPYCPTDTLWPGSATGCVVVSHIRQAVLGAARPLEMGVAMRTLHKPEATEHVILPGEEIRHTELGFKLADVTAACQGDDLLLNFADGAQLIFTDYFQLNSGQYPDLNFADGLKHLGPDDYRSDWDRPHDKAEREPGQRDDDDGANGTDGPGARAGVSADSGADARASAPQQSSPSPAQEAQIQSALQQADAPRAGPNSQGNVQESNYHAWDNLELLDGRPHLGPLDVGWTRGWNQEYLRTSAGRQDDGGDGISFAETAVVSPTPGDQPPPPNALPVIGGADVALEVREAGVCGNDPALDHLGNSNTAYAGKITASGSAAATDPDGDALTWLVRGTGGSGTSAETNYGSVSISPDGSYTYTLNESRSNVLAQGETKTDSFTLLLNDGRGGTAEQVVTVKITGTNDAPVLNFAEGEDGIHRLHYSGETDTGTLRVDDPDSDGKLGGSTGGKLNQQFEITTDSGTTGIAGQDTGTGGATFTIPGKGVLTVNPNGTYSFEYTGSGVSSEESLNFVVKTIDAHDSVSNEQIITVTLAPNRKPIITPTEHNHAVTESGVREGGNLPFTDTPSASGKVEATDADGDSLSYSVDRNDGIYGRLELHADGSYIYTLDNAKGATQELKAGETKTDVFTVTVSDGHGGTVSQIITVNVTGTNDVPTLDFATGTGSHSFTDNGSSLHDTGAFAVDDSDSDGAAGKMVTVNGASKASQTFSIAGTDGTTGTGTPHADGSISFTTDYGTLTIDKNGNYTYTLNPNAEKVIALGETETYTEHFTVMVTDAHGAVSETKPITVTITGKDDAPKITGATDTNSVVEKGVEAHTNTDKDGTPEVRGSLSAEHTDGDAHNEIAFTLANSVGVPGGGPSSVTLSDENRTLTTDYGTLKLTPTGLADGKYGCDYSFELNNCADLVNKLPEGQTVTLKFKVQATDESGTHPEDLIVTITGSNDRPEITAIDRPSAVVEDGVSMTTGQVSATDVDTGDSLNYSLADAGGATVQILEGQYGRLEIIQGTGKYTYYLNNGKAQSLAEGEIGLDAFTVRVTDKLGAYTEKTLEIPITGKDDAPVLGNLTGTVTEDKGSHDATPLPGDEVTISGAVRVTDTDALDTDKTFRLDGSVDVSGNSVGGNGSVETPYMVEGKYGTLTFHSDGSYTYTLLDNALNDIQKLNEEDQLTDSFEITATTDHGVFSSSSSGTLVITIQGSNDNPVITSHNDLLVNQGNAITPTVTGNLAISDVDDAVNQAAAGTHNHTFYFRGEGGAELQSMAGRFGVLTVNQFTGEYTYTVNQYASGLGVGGTETFIVWVEDAHGGTASQEITVNLGALANPPVPPGLSYTLTGNALAVTEDDFAPGTTNVQDNDTATASSGSGPFGFAVSVDGGSRFTQTVTGMYGTITINDGGVYTYTLNNSLASVQSLREGATLTENFQLWGTGSSQIAVTITGTNDRPEVSLSDVHLSVTQTDGADAATAAGVASATDIDQGDTHTFWLDAACTTKTQYYAFTLDDDGKIIGGPTLTNGANAHFRVDIEPNTGKYTLTYLAGGPHFTQDDTRDVIFTVYTMDDSGATDGSAASDPVTVTVTIKGTNAGPEWHTEPAGIVTEDAFHDGDHSQNITVSGTFLTDGGVTDDTGNTADSGLSFNINGNTSLLKGNYGTLLITDARTGEYTYTLDNAMDAVQALGVDESLTETFKIWVSDKHGGKSEQDFNITINGANDAPTLNACSDLHLTATANSASATSANAAAVGHDVDAHDHDSLTYDFSFDAAAAGDNRGLNYNDYGTFDIDLKNGEYTFTLDNSKAAVKALTDSESVSLHFKVTVSDGHGGTAEQDTVVHISGVNDAPEFVDADGNPLGSTLDARMDISGAVSPLMNTINAHDVDGDTVHYHINGNASGVYGDLSIDPDTGNYTYKLHDGLTAADLPIDAQESFIILASDGNTTNGTDSVALNITISGGSAAPTSLSLSSLLADVPDEGDSPLLSSLITENASLDSLLGGADNASAPADPATLPGAETSHAAAPLSAPVDLAAPTSGEEEAVARMVLEYQVA